MKRAKPVSERDLEVLRDLCSQSDWARPMDCGGTDSSHHSATLARLVRWGFAERKRRAGWTRPSWLYRITGNGIAASEVSK